MSHPPPSSHSTRRRFHPRTAAKLAWPRFWARLFDYAIWWWVVAGAAALLRIPLPLRGRELILAALIGPVAVGVLQLAYEVLILAAIGTTAGKSLFGLRVETQRGNRVPLARIIDRSVGAWLHGSYAYVLFPLASIVAWKKSRERLLADGLTQWDRQPRTEVTGPALPMWHLSAGAALAVAAFAMLLWQTTVRGDRSDAARVGDSAKRIGAGTSQSPASSQNGPIGFVQGGRAVFPANAAQKSFAIATPLERPSASKSAEVLALWAEHHYPYFVGDAPERRAMFAWMVAGTRVGMSRSGALAQGIDIVTSGRDNGRGTCWPADPPPEAASQNVTAPQSPPLGITCEQ